MSGPKRGLAPVLGAVLMLGLAACSDGCAHELPVTVPSSDAPMSFLELQKLLWPETEDRWEPLPDRQIVALEQLVVILLERAEAGYFGGAQIGRVERLALEAGLELRMVELQLEPAPGREPDPSTAAQPSVETLWVLVEPADDRRGRGAYVFRLGELAARRGDRVEQLLQAPHSRFDKYSGEIALGMFVERDLGMQPPRALFLNSAHRHRQLDGSRTRLEPPARNPADAAHQPDHPFARATALALRERSVAVVQLHGFERKLALQDPDAIISSGSKRPSATSEATLRRLRASFPSLPMAHYGVDADRLGGETNVQGQAAKAAGRCFLHIEVSETLRLHLRDDREARRRFAVALFGAEQGELRGACE